MFVGIINYAHSNNVADADLAKHSFVLYESIITVWSKMENKPAEKPAGEQVNEKYLQVNEDSGTKLSRICLYTYSMATEKPGSSVRLLYPADSM